jgi:hypothetical protein
MRALVGLLLAGAAFADVSTPSAVTAPPVSHDLFLGVDKLGNAAFVRRDEFRVTTLAGERSISRCDILVFDDDGNLAWQRQQQLNLILDGRISDASWSGDNKKLPIPPRATCEEAVAALSALREWKPAAAVAAIGVAKDLHFFTSEPNAELGSEAKLNRAARHPVSTCAPLEGRWRRFRAANSRASFVATYADGDDVPSGWVIIPRGWHLRSGDGC